MFRDPRGASPVGGRRARPDPGKVGRAGGVGPAVQRKEKNAFETAFHLLRRAFPRERVAAPSTSPPNVVRPSGEGGRCRPVVLRNLDPPGGSASGHGHRDRRSPSRSIQFTRATVLSRPKAT